MKIAIISSSVRVNRSSHRVALFFKNYIENHQLAESEILDLMAYQFPVFDERLKFQKSPLPHTLEFADKVRRADGVIIVTPEYNGGYPAALKNVTDLLYDEWRRKPIAISTVSAGAFAGSQVITSLQFSLWKIGALVVPAMFPVPNIHQSFNEEGLPSDLEATEKRAKRFLEELIWWMKAVENMK